MIDQEPLRNQDTIDSASHGARAIIVPIHEPARCRVDAGQADLLHRTAALTSSSRFESGEQVGSRFDDVSQLNQICI